MKNKFLWILAILCAVSILLSCKTSKTDCDAYSEVPPEYKTA